MTANESIVETKAGVPFTAYVLLWNNGDDGITTVQAICDGEVIAERSWQSTAETGAWLKWN